MEKYLCQGCNQHIFCHLKDRHELYCLNSIQENEYNNLIPCELCSEFIEFDKYNEHINNCGIMPPSLFNILQQFPIHNNLINIPQNNNENNIDNSNQEVNQEDSNQEDNTNIPDFAISLLNMVTQQLGNIEQPSNEPASEPNVEPENGTQIENILHSLINNLNQNNNPNFSIMLNPIPTNVNLNINDIPLNIPINNLPIPNMGNYEELTNLINQVGNVSVGVDDINKYTIIKSKNIECPICKQKTEFIRETSCNHEFCLSCINEWTQDHKSCPMCMQELKEI